jgi:hypothetical protein
MCHSLMINAAMMKYCAILFKKYIFAKKEKKKKRLSTKTNKFAIDLTDVGWLQKIVAPEEGHGMKIFLR